MNDLNALDLPDLYRNLSVGDAVRRLFTLARDEDLSPLDDRLHGDITSAVSIEEGTRARAAIRARTGGVLAGMAALPELLDVYRADVRLAIDIPDGESIEPGAALARLEGSLRDILAVERPLLNTLGRLSGVATLTARFVEAVRAAAPNGPANLYDTRKTTPGWRALEKYAVRCGGGRCHRLGLYDAVLLKDNHIAGVDAVRPLAARVETMARAARSMRREEDLRFIEVEVDTLEQLDEILSLEPGLIDIVLLDNMTADQLTDAVTRRDRAGSPIHLEASGGVSLETVGEIACAGVDRISVGMITQSAPALDVGLDL